MSDPGYTFPGFGPYLEAAAKRAGIEPERLPTLNDCKQIRRATHQIGTAAYHAGEDAQAILAHADQERDMLALGVLALDDALAEVRRELDLPSPDTRLGVSVRPARSLAQPPVEPPSENEPRTELNPSNAELKFTGGDPGPDPNPEAERVPDDAPEVGIPGDEVESVRREPQSVEPAGATDDRKLSRRERRARRFGPDGTPESDPQRPQDGLEVPVVPGDTLGDGPPAGASGEPGRTDP